MSTTPAPDPTSGGTLREAIGQARAEVQATPVSEPAAPPDEGAPSESEPASTPAISEEFLENATAEEIAAIRADPRLAKVYNSMLRDYKGKTAKISEREKEFEERQREIQTREQQTSQAYQLYQALQQNPQAVIRALAERNGLSLAQATTQAEAIDDELKQMFGEDAPAVKPLFDRAVEKRAKAVVDASLGPVIEHLNQQAVEQERAEIGAEMKEFRAELKAEGLPLTPEIEKSMVELVEKIDQSDSLSTKEYVRYLYQIATYGQTRGAIARDIAGRMAATAARQEPREVPSSALTPGTAALDPKLSFRESIAVARQEVQRGR